jgi:hypothetical protein
MCMMSFVEFLLTQETMFKVWRLDHVVAKKQSFESRSFASGSAQVYW